MYHEWIVNREDANIRLLSFIKNRIKEKTTLIRFAIEHQGCRVNKRIERFCSRKLRVGEVVEFRLENKPALALQQKAVLFEDNAILIYAKPARLSSEELASHFQLELVHRLDRDTTGILIFAKEKTMLEELQTLFRKREVQKKYLAIVHGDYPFEKRVLHNQLALIKRLPGKVIWGVKAEGSAMAITELSTLRRTEKHTYLSLAPKTGRTHQLRVQLSHLGYPIVGDVDYGNKESWERRLLLHASEIIFNHPYTQEKIHISCPLPSDFKRFLEHNSLN